MTAVLILAATIILLALIIWRGHSPDFRSESEYPKFRFLENLGISVSRPATLRDAAGEPLPNPEPTTEEEPKND